MKKVNFLKSICIIMALVVLLVASACSGQTTNQPEAQTPAQQTSNQPNASTETSGKKITLTLNTHVYTEAPHKKAIDMLIDGFNQKHENVKMEVFGTNYDTFWDNLVTDIMSGNEADITFIYPENLPMYNTMRPEGVFVDLSDKIKGTDYETNLIGQKYCVQDGKYYGLACYSYGTSGIFYMKSVFEEAGIDPESIKTLDDLRDAAIRTTKDGMYGLSFIVAQHDFTISEWARMIARPVSGGLYFPNEAPPYTADRLQVNSAENIWAAEWLQDLILETKAARIVKTKKETRELLWNKQVAMSHDGPWFIGMTRDRDPKLLDDLGVIPLPDVVYNGKTYKPNPTLYTMCCMISQKCEYKDIAWEFLEYMASDEGQQCVENNGEVPCSISYIERSGYKERNPLSYKFVEFMQNNYADVLLPDPSLPQLNEIKQVMIDELQNVFASGEDATACLNRASDKIKEILNK